VKKLDNPVDLKYTKEHEWIKIESDTGTVGITDFAQHALTDVVFVELPEIGRKVEQFKQAATIESVKSVSDIYAPVSGEIIEVNNDLEENPEIINKDPFGNGWVFKIKINNKKEIDNLMEVDKYNGMINKGGH